MPAHASIALAVMLLSLAAASPFTLTAYLPYHNLNGQVANAAGQSLFLGLPGPSSYCPSPPVPAASCPPGNKTLFVGALSMWVNVPGGQEGYIDPSGAFRYTGPHSSFMPPGSFIGGYTATNVTSHHDTKTLLNWEAPGAECGGIYACPNVPDWSHATYQIYAKTPKFNQTGCVKLEGLLEHQQRTNDFGAWEYT